MVSNELESGKNKSFKMTGGMPVHALIGIIDKDNGN
jgi:hypothetical protein